MMVCWVVPTVSFLPFFFSIHLSSFLIPLLPLKKNYFIFFHLTSFLSDFHFNVFVVRLKSLQAQEDARHKNSENRRTESSKSERRGISGKRTGDARSAETRGSDTRNTETTSEYEKHLQNLKDEISGLSAEKSGLQGRSDKL